MSCRLSRRSPRPTPQRRKPESGCLTAHAVPAGEPTTSQGRSDSGGGPAAGRSSSGGASASASGSAGRGGRGGAATLGNWPSMVQTGSPRDLNATLDGPADVGPRAHGGSVTGGGTDSRGPAVHAGLAAGAFAGTSSDMEREDDEAARATPGTVTTTTGGVVIRSNAAWCAAHASSTEKPMK